MNGQTWQECGEPQAMIQFLGRDGTDRQWRLFACACARMSWHLLGEEGRRAIESAERFADGLTLPKKLAEIGFAVKLPPGRFREEARKARESAASAARLCTTEDPHFAARAWESAAAALAWEAASGLPPTRQVRLTWEVARKANWVKQTTYLRDIFTPFTPKVRVEAAWLSWERGVVRSLAEAIYEERTFERLPILADALEEAGCTDEHLLGHLRSDAEHVRGCWGLELVLGAPGSAQAPGGGQAVLFT